MRPLVVAALAALFVQCTRSPEDLSTPAATSAPAASSHSDAPPDPASPDPGSTVDASSAPAPMSDAGDAGPTDPDAMSAADGARCMQPTPATAPPPVAPGPAAGCPRDPGSNQNVPIVQVAFPDAGGAAVNAELVSSPADTERGLMYRTSMPEDHGMLFDLKVPGHYELWMHDTCIPLDMVFADVDGFIVGIVENAPPLDDTPRSVSCPSRYVLEVNAGWTRAHGVKAGQTMTIPAQAR